MITGWRGVSSTEQRTRHLSSSSLDKRRKAYQKPLAVRGNLASVGLGESYNCASGVNAPHFPDGCFLRENCLSGKTP